MLRAADICRGIAHVYPAAVKIADSLDGYAEMLIVGNNEPQEKESTDVSTQNEPQEKESTDVSTQTEG